MSEDIDVEVAYATPAKQVIVPLVLKRGATLREAIEASGILTQFPEIDIDHCDVGVFSKLSKLDTVLRDKDRVEIYRPLIADAKEIRKQRAKGGKAAKKGEGAGSAET
jgi:uncharacterized protein